MARLYNLARMTTATTGTGTMTLGSAVSGFLSFASAGISNGDTVTYAIKDGSNSEIGRGVYTSSGTTLTRSVLKSTNSNAAISLSGTAEVFITPAAEDLLKREIVTTNLTYYVRTDGSDSNTGLANTSGGAFLTIQKAVDTASSLDLAIYNVTIQIGTGTYTGAVTLKSTVGAGTIIIQGDLTTPSNVVISTTSNHCFYGDGVLGNYAIQGVKMQTTTSGNAIYLQNGTKVSITTVDFGACAQTHMLALAAIITITGNYTISGSVGASGRHYYATQLGSINIFGSITVTLTGTPAFFYFALIDRLSFCQLSGITFSGSATGTRYNVSANSVVYTNGGGASYFPGNSAGSTSNGGLYL